MIRFCLVTLGILTSDADRVEQLDHLMHRAFGENASVTEYADAVLHLQFFEEALKRRKTSQAILTWVDEKVDPPGNLYASLQRLKREYGK